MKITVSEGAYLVARLKRSDPYAEQHILDIVHSIEKGQGKFWIYFIVAKDESALCWANLKRIYKVSWTLS